MGGGGGVMGVVCVCVGGYGVAISNIPLYFTAFLLASHYFYHVALLFPHPTIFCPSFPSSQ